MAFGRSWPGEPDGQPRLWTFPCTSESVAGLRRGCKFLCCRRQLVWPNGQQRGRTGVVAMGECISLLLLLSQAPMSLSEAVGLW